MGGWKGGKKGRRKRMGERELCAELELGWVGGGEWGVGSWEWGVGSWEWGVNGCGWFASSERMGMFGVWVG